jgi:hypothetical protein
MLLSYVLITNLSEVFVWDTGLLMQVEEARVVLTAH